MQGKLVEPGLGENGQILSQCKSAELTSTELHQFTPAESLAECLLLLMGLFDVIHEPAPISGFLVLVSPGITPKILH